MFSCRALDLGFTVTIATINLCHEHRSSGARIRMPQYPDGRRSLSARAKIGLEISSLVIADYTLLPGNFVKLNGGAWRKGSRYLLGHDPQPRELQIPLLIAC